MTATAIDLSVIMTAHNETVVVGPTIRSVEAAVEKARAGGFTVELILAFDTPSAECREFFAQECFRAWKTLDFEFRDQGKTRCAAIAEAGGLSIALIDADDLFSENWLIEAAKLLRDARQQSRRIIVRPELNWQFDGANPVYTKPAQRDPLFMGHYLAIANCYDALCAAPRQVWEEHPYTERNIKAGFAYEDWQWAIETMDAGWENVCAKDTIIFKRRRDTSQNRESVATSATLRGIDALLIDRIRSLGKIPAN